jgi:serine/threonine-protein kinase HipA
VTHRLHVTTLSAAVGEITLHARDDNYGFQYQDAWAKSATGYYLAPTIPLSDVPNSAGSVKRFLENLLPEGRALDIAASMSQVSKSNIFALVGLLGKEPVGAFSFLALDASPDEAAGIGES